MEFDLQPGMKLTLEKIVEEKDTASQMGNGDVEVLATPILIGWMEEVALTLVKPRLPEGFDTVGTVVNMAHLAATPVGMKVRLEAELTKVKGSLLEFHIEAFDEVDKICTATHGRAVIQLGKFLAKVQQKGKQ